MKNVKNVSYGSTYCRTEFASYILKKYTQLLLVVACILYLYEEVWGGLFAQIGFEVFASRCTAQFINGFIFDLAHALAGQPKSVADVFER